MQRRGFLGMLGAVVSAPLAPHDTAPLPATNLTPPVHHTVTVRLDTAELDRLARHVSEQIMRSAKLSRRFTA